MTDKIEIDIIEIKKAKKAYNKNKKDKRAQWMMFMDNPEDKEVKKIMEENKSIEKAKIEVVKMSYDEKMRKLADLREKAIKDEKSAYSTGLHKGMRLGEEKGSRKKEIEIIKKLYEKGMRLEEIIELTDIEISKVKEILNIK